MLKRHALPALGTFPHNSEILAPPQLALPAFLFSQFQFYFLAPGRDITSTTSTPVRPYPRCSRGPRFSRDFAQQWTVHSSFWRFDRHSRAQPTAPIFSLAAVQGQPRRNLNPTPHGGQIYTGLGFMGWGSEFLSAPYEEGKRNEIASFQPHQAD